MNSESFNANSMAGLSYAEQIQCCFPDEPDWDTVPDDTLIELIEKFPGELSCASIAFTNLQFRGNQEANRLARWLLGEYCPDRWLRYHAFEVLTGLEINEKVIFKCPAPQTAINAFLDQCCDGWDRTSLEFFFHVIGNERIGWISNYLDADAVLNYLVVTQAASPERPEIYVIDRVLACRADDEPIEVLSMLRNAGYL